jgi:hypothetical protein
MSGARLRGRGSISTQAFPGNDSPFLANDPPRCSGTAFPCPQSHPWWQTGFGLRGYFDTPRGMSSRTSRVLRPYSRYSRTGTEIFAAAQHSRERASMNCLTEMGRPSVFSISPYAGGSSSACCQCSQSLNGYMPISKRETGGFVAASSAMGEEKSSVHCGLSSASMERSSVLEGFSRTDQFRRNIKISFPSIPGGFCGIVLAFER